MRKVLGVIQCRMSSTRLPGKAMITLDNRPVLEWLILRMRRSRMLDELVLATTIDDEDDIVVEMGKKHGLSIVRGDKENLLKRYSDAIEQFPSETIVRITADNPFTDPETMDKQIEFFSRHRFDYSYTADIPYGAGTDIFNCEKLLFVAGTAEEPGHKEHINTYFLDHPEHFKLGVMSLEDGLRRADVRVTLDTPEDRERLQHMFHLVEDPVQSGLTEIIEAYDRLPDCLRVTGSYK